ncbi:MAG: HDOD domain-containing protein [Fibrobacterota bacterium]
MIPDRERVLPSGTGPVALPFLKKVLIYYLEKIKSISSVSLYICPAFLVNLINHAGKKRGVLNPVSTVSGIINILKDEGIKKIAAESDSLSENDRRIYSMPFLEAALHSAAAAEASYIISGYLDPRMEVNPDTARCAGFIHDIGKYLLCLDSSENYERAVDFSDTRSVNVLQGEFSVFGYDHTDAGGDAFIEWKFAPELFYPVRDHHEPFKSGYYSKYSAVVHVADSIACALGYSQHAVGSQPPVYEECLDKLSLAEETISETAAEVYDNMKKMKPLYEDIYGT